MTLDATIGQLSFDLDDRNRREIESRRGGSVNIRMMGKVKECPEADENICDPDRTIYPKTSVRSGSSGFWRFWR